MKTTIRIIALFIASIGFAQQVNMPLTFALGYTSSNAAAVLTLTWPANTPVFLKPQSGFITCPADCTLTPEISSNAATATLATPISLRGRSETSSALAYTASNIASAGALQGFLCKANLSCPFDLSFIRLDKNSPTIQSLTLRSSLSTGNQVIQIIYQESDQP